VEGASAMSGMSRVPGRHDHCGGLSGLIFAFAISESGAGLSPSGSKPTSATGCRLGNGPRSPFRSASHPRSREPVGVVRYFRMVSPAREQISRGQSTEVQPSWW